MTGPWKWLTGVLCGVLIMLGMYTCTEKKRSTDEINAIRDTLALHDALRPTLMFDTAWKHVIVYQAKYIRIHDTITDTIELDDESCVLHWYNDSLRFDDLLLRYNISTYGTLEEMSYDYKVKSPELVYVPTPIPCPPVPMQSPKWSAQLMIGWPAAAYIGAGYGITPKIDITGGVHTSLTSPQKADMLIGVKVGL